MSASSPSSSTPHAPRRPRVDKENASPQHHRQQHNDDDAFLNEMLSWCGSSGSKGSACTATHAVHVNNNNNNSSNNNSNNNTMHTPQKLATHTRDVNVSPCVAAHVDGASTTYTDAPHDDDDDDKAMLTTATTTTTTTTTTNSSCRACHNDDTDATSACVLPLPDELHARLYAHQRDGVQWLYTQHCRARACLLADEMGLGKTIQVCALLGCLYARGEARTTIIIAPTSLLALWQSALQSWAMLASPVVEVVQRGSSAQRAARWRRLTHGVPCVLLTSYGVLRRDVQAMRCAVADYVVYDEVQLVKDARTRVAASARVLCARHKVGLTGTPLMNSFADLWAVFQCLDNSLHLPATRNSNNNNGNNNGNDASPASFARVNATLMRGNERGATAAVRRDAAAALAQLRALLAPHMLRREKRQLGDAVVSSNKHDVVVWVVLSDVQQRQYAACLAARPALTTTTMRDDNDEDDDNDNNDDNDTQQQLVHAHGAQALLLLTTLQQICSHPWLCLTDAAFRDALTRPFVAPCDDVGDVCSSTKLRVCMALLTRSVNAGHKVLVFARSRRLLQLLEVWLRQWWLPYSRLDGDTNAAQRQCVVDAFNRDAAVRVCLLTTQVGGVGLTFTAASCVVLLEPSWNASCDAQAIDRVHRIGQQHRDVLVYRIVTCGTVEETIYRNQIFKSMAAAQATAMARHATTTHDDNNDDNDDATTLFRYFTRTQLRRMFVLGDLQRSATARQLRMLHPTSTLPAAVAAMTCDVPHIADVSNHGCVLHERVATTATAAAAYDDDDDDNDDNDDDAVSARCASTSTRPRRSHSPHATRPAGDDDDDDTLTMTTVLQPQPRQRQRQRSSAAATTTTTSSTTSSTKAEGDACARVRRPAQLLRADNDAREHVRAHELQCIEACVHDVHDDDDNDDDALVTRMSSSMSSLRECVEPPDVDNDDDDR